MPAIAAGGHLEKAKRLRQLLAAYARSEDLIRIGAYQKGADPDLDRAVETLPKLNGFLRQGVDELVNFASAVKALEEVPG